MKPIAILRFEKQNHAAEAGSVLARPHGYYGRSPIGQLATTMEMGAISHVEIFRWPDGVEMVKEARNG